MRVQAEVNYLTGSSWPVTTITRQRADRFTMYAPGWRPMAFSTLEKAKKPSWSATLVSSAGWRLEP